MADNNKVTIDAAWFAELYGCWQSMNDKTYCDRGICGKIIDERNKTEQAIKERDELKAKLEDAKKHYCTSATGKIGDACALARRCTELDDTIVKEQDKRLKVIKELNEVRELNRKCCDENEDLKAKLEQERMNKCDEVTANRLAAAELCIDEIYRNIDCKEADEIIGSIIRAYREKEAK